MDVAEVVEEVVSMIKERKRRRIMGGNSFGSLFRITTWGESHGEALGVVIDGCPPRMELSEEDIQKEMDRRRPGQGKGNEFQKRGRPGEDPFRSVRGDDHWNTHFNHPVERGC